MDPEDIDEYDQEVAIENAQMRAEYFRSQDFFTAADIHEMSGGKSTNQGEPASRWQREKKAFSVKYQGASRFPSFLFEHGKPKPVIKRILLALPENWSDWEIAFWFASGNGYLDGKAPEACLDQPEKVVQAANYAREKVLG